MTKPIIRSTPGPSNFATKLQKVKESAMNSEGDHIEVLVKAFKKSDLLNLTLTGKDRAKWSVKTTVETSIGLKSMEFFLRILDDLLRVELLQESKEAPIEIKVLCKL